MKRIAYLSPVNPAPSGISDYSEELLPYLGQYADLTVYLDDGLHPTNPHIRHHLELRPIRRLERDQRRRPFDAILYHMGNSPVHAAIWRAMQRLPGVLVLHDFVLHHFFLNYAAVVRRDVDGYRAEAARRYGPEGERVANLMLHGRFTPAAFEFPFSEEVIAAADGLIAHSRYVLERATALRPGLPAALVPMGVPLPPAIPRDEARTRLGLPRDALLLASFGHINPYKRLEVILRALRTLREEFDARYLLVGSISPSYNVRTAIARAGLAEAVTITGYVERATFEDYVAAADICLNLRHPTAGETSASLLRLLGAARPTLVSASGSFTELPPGVAAQVDIGPAEEELIVAYCRLLARRPEVAAAMGTAARAYVAQEHTLDRAARGYIRFLATRYGWGEVPRARGPLWEVGRQKHESSGQESGASRQKHESRSQELEPGTQHQRSEHRTQRSALGEQPSVLSSVAQALVEIGATDADTTLLAAAALALTEIRAGPGE